MVCRQVSLGSEAQAASARLIVLCSLQVVHADPARRNPRPVAGCLQNRHASAVLQAPVGVRVRLRVGSEVAVRNLCVTRASTGTYEQRGSGHPIRAVACALDRAARLSGRLGGVVHTDPTAGSATPVALGFEQSEAQAVLVGADDAVVDACTAAHVKRRCGHRVCAADAIALGAVVAGRCLCFGGSLLHGAADMTRLHVGRNLGLELVPGLAVLHEIFQRVRVVGTSPTHSSIVVADHAVDSPPAFVQVVTRPLNRFVPLLVEIGFIRGMAKLDIHAVGVAVANGPCLAVVGHRVVHNSAIQVHDVLHGVLPASAVQAHMVVGTRSWVAGLVDHQVARV